MKELAIAALAAGGVCVADATSASLPLTQVWDKTFPKSDKVEHAKVTFRNRFGITLAANGYFDKEDSAAARKAKKEAMNAQRIKDFKSGTCELGGGVPDKLPEDAPQFVKDYYAYYKTPRGYHVRSLNSNGGWNKTSALSFINAKLLAYAGEIEGAVMVLHGEKAHSRYFGEDAFKMLKGDGKELVIVPGASHCDLYDGGGKNAIPFDRIEAFYRKNLK